MSTNLDFTGGKSGGEEAGGEELAARKRLDAILAGMKRPLVALSGGVDSALLAARAALRGGGAATLRGSMYAAEETERARSLARQLGIRHYEVFVDSLAVDEIRRNPADRCYHCRKCGMGKLAELARAEGYGVVIDGENADDAADYRPGVRAMRELGLRGPLREAGLGKLWIRRWSAELGLPTADLPAAACLASRFPPGVPLSDEALRRVERAEIFLRRLGLRQVRVRHHGEVARIETDSESIEFLAGRGRREEIVDEFVRLGYRRVALDLAGYQAGSLNPLPA
ncbi:MAG: ATP-dependent sacrificial sulfur transferase LarE [Planctomycetota bacterium]|jgi:uncharacterized protein|nr:ATP-dependent sacrificial sulfur transferase LarE [Planctomycetota bacterium]